MSIFPSALSPNHGFPPAESTAWRWYAIQVKGKLTREVADTLQRKGYDAFTPVQKQSRRWSDRMGIVEVPLFPGYVFANFDFRERMPVLTTPGVYGLVGIGKQAIAIERQEIANVRSLMRSGLQVEPWPFPRCGDRVEIESGPLAGLTGVLADVKKSCRLVVSVELIERSIAVEVDPDAVRVMKPAKRARAPIAM